MKETPEATDCQYRYDSVSRSLHWLMALMFAGIYCLAAVHNLLSDSVLDKLLWPYHKPVGLLLLVLLILRAGWSLLNRHNRPPSMNLAASIGHGALYGLMLLIPLIGLLRQYGSGRAFSAFGLQVMDGFEGEKIQWMIDLGSNFHGWLGWTMLVLIVGHIGAVILHHRQGNSQVLRRMTGTTHKT
ncbi:Cytochrome b561 [Pseudomonas fluorescens]|uniref:Cytochrome b561 n=1 Tax=Pseudomonas fluorescens TaxID=294 RepID=A0A5E6TBA9_PSEFL|nr:cytochrome b [Pseudomonas fluorescens]VVM86945.1 Cytochrome b561 [Pseudomonas fluorescens]VVP11236.1 Cytochrome b561 [Pseudomonas fluorescens]